jgi:hypothetical protein
VPDQETQANQIAEAIISELDHFQQNFQPQGGERTGPGQNQLVHEPCVGYAVAQRPDGTSADFFSWPMKNRWSAGKLNMLNCGAAWPERSG